MGKKKKGTKTKFIPNVDNNKIYSISKTGIREGLADVQCVKHLPCIQ